MRIFNSDYIFIVTMIIVNSSSVVYNSKAVPVQGLDWFPNRAVPRSNPEWG